jgi:hypothetical protein
MDGGFILPSSSSVHPRGCAFVTPVVFLFPIEMLKAKSNGQDGRKRNMKENDEMTRKDAKADWGLVNEEGRRRDLRG